jgi:hypothetical protein
MPEIPSYMQGGEISTASRSQAILTFIFCFLSGPAQWLDHLGIQGLSYRIHGLQIALSMHLSFFEPHQRRPSS